VFKLTPNGVLTTLVAFTGNNVAQPYATLILGRDGDFYGTTPAGIRGNDSARGISYPATIFKITSAGVLNHPRLFHYGQWHESRGRIGGRE